MKRTTVAIALFVCSVAVHAEQSQRSGNFVYSDLQRLVNKANSMDFVLKCRMQGGVAIASDTEPGHIFCFPKYLFWESDYVPEFLKDIGDDNE